MTLDFPVGLRWWVPEKISWGHLDLSPGQLLVLRVMPTTLGRQTRVPICCGSPSPIDDGAPRFAVETTKTQRQWQHAHPSIWWQVSDQ